MPVIMSPSSTSEAGTSVFSAQSTLRSAVSHSPDLLNGLGIDWSPYAAIRSATSARTIPWYTYGLPLLVTIGRTGAQTAFGQAETGQGRPEGPPPHRICPRSDARSEGRTLESQRRRR